LINLILRRIAVFSPKDKGRDDICEGEEIYLFIEVRQRIKIIPHKLILKTDIELAN
jgi:hypothetical protein